MGVCLGLLLLGSTNNWVKLVTALLGPGKNVSQEGPDTSDGAKEDPKDRTD